MALVAFFLTTVRMALIVLSIWSESTDEARLRHEEWQWQREQYKSIRHQWKRHRGWQRLAPWMHPLNLRPAVPSKKSHVALAVLAVMAALTNGLVTWRDLSSGRQPHRKWSYSLPVIQLLATYLRATGLVPSTLWIPKPLTRAARALFSVLMILVLPFAALGALAKLRLAFVATDEYERCYQEAEERWQRRQKQQRELEHLSEHEPRRRWWQVLRRRAD
jgi:hypothetical protein